ncbi:MAG: phosphohydrolase, partial [bacterium]|nr:phosphohydrolase [bacterium]
MNFRSVVVLAVLLFFFTGSPLLYAVPETVAERIILNLTAHPEHEIAVTWRGNYKKGRARVEYMEAVAGSPESSDASGEAYEKTRKVKGRTETVNAGKDARAQHHSAVLKGLQPDTLYQYRVGDGRYWSEWSHFRTARTGRHPFTFIYLGDPQNSIKSLCSRTFRAAFSAAPNARFILIPGDLVSEPWNDKQWGELFYAAGWLPRQIPVIAVPGNHGYYKRRLFYTYTSDAPHPLWFAHLTLPENGVKGMEETCYTFDYQGVRFALLNGNEKFTEQALWLDGVLAHNPNRWTIISIHQPFYSTGLERDNPKLRAAFLPVIDKYRVDLVLQGHDHTYGRTRRLRNGKVDPKGTIYVSSVSGPKFYELNPKYKTLMAKTGVDSP